MKPLFGNRLVSKLALAALAVGFFAVSGKAQDTHKGSAEAPVCTAYPEWSCETQRAPDREVLSAKTPEKAAKMTEKMDGPSCTSYPEWSCEPQTVSSRSGSKPLIARMKRGRESERDAFDSASAPDESFERRP